MPRHTFPRGAALVVFAATALAIAPSDTRGAVARRHVYLVKSEPAAHDTISAPDAVRLWFSEEIELKVTRIRIVNSAGSAVLTKKPAHAKAGEDAPIVATVGQPLAPGSYTVNWRTAAKDGHPANGTIDFVVKSAR